MAASLTHLDAEGRARMIDVGAKPATRREALARGRMVTTAEVVRLLVADGLPKADALATARIAGIAGAKRTSDLIPLCHPLPIDAVTVDLRPQGDSVRDRGPRLHHRPHRRRDGGPDRGRDRRPRPCTTW